MASFTSLGVGSNLPLDTLLNNLTIAEKKRLNPITQQQSDNTARLTAYGTLKSALEKFQTANTALNKADLFKSTTVTSSNEDLKVSTEAGAAPGIYTISVTQLAQAQSLRTDSPTIIASTKDALGDESSDTRTIPKTAVKSRWKSSSIKIRRHWVRSAKPLTMPIVEFPLVSLKSKMVTINWY